MSRNHHFLLLALPLAGLFGAQPPDTGSVRLDIRLNETATLHARKVVLASPDGRHHRAALKGDEFRVPKALLSNEKLDVTIDLPTESLELHGMSQRQFSGTWHLFLSDSSVPRRFELPEAAKPEQVCVLEFGVAKGDPVEMALWPCRHSLGR